MAYGSTNSMNRMQDMVNKVNKPTDPPKKTTKFKIDTTSSTPVKKQMEYFKWLKENNLEDTHKNRENYNPK